MNTVDLEIAKTLIISSKLEKEFRDRIIEWRKLDFGAKYLEKYKFDRRTKTQRKVDANTGLPDKISFSEIIAVFFKIAREALPKCNKNIEELESRSFAIRLPHIRNAAAHHTAEWEFNFYHDIVEFARMSEFDALQLNFDSIVDLAEQLAEPSVENIDTIIFDEDIQWGDYAHIPNNLPQRPEHYGTGLIGRTKQLQDLRKFIYSKNPIAAVYAPGGIGKTALALEFLSRLSCVENYSDDIDAIIFVTLKDIKLTYRGNKNIKSTDSTITALEDAILNALSETLEDSVGETIEDYSCKRVLLCIDNLENLLIDEPEAFEEFWNEKIPSRWKTIITSRISPGFFSNVRLNNLSPLDSNTLCRALFSKYPDFPVDINLIDSALKVSAGNPLALKLFVDYIVRGSKEIHEATECTAENVLQFSFSHLAKSLSNSELIVLSTLFVLGDPATKAEICAISELNTSDFEIANNRLKLAGLVEQQRSQNRGYLFCLHSGAKDYIITNDLFNPHVSEIDARQKKFRVRAQSSSHLFSLNMYSFNFVDEHEPDEIKSMIADVLKHISYYDTELLKKQDMPWFQNHAKMYESSACFNYYYGRIHQMLRSPAHYTRQAYESGSKLGDTKYKYICDLFLAKMLIVDSQVDSAVQILSDLYKNDLYNPANSSPEFAEKLIKNYMRSLIYTKQYEIALSISENWEHVENTELQRTYGYGRASALGRLSERTINNNFSWEPLERQRDVLLKLLENHPDDLSIGKLCNKFLDRINGFMRLPQCDYNHGELLAIDFISRSRGKFEISDNTNIFISKLSSVNSNKEPNLNSSPTSNWLQSNGYISANIIRCAPSWDYFFAIDNQELHHYVPRPSYSTLNKIPWAKLKPNDVVYLKSVENRVGKAHFKAFQAFFPNDE